MKDFKLEIYLYLSALGCAWGFIWSQHLIQYGLFLLLFLGISWYFHPIIYKHYNASKKLMNFIVMAYLIYFILDISFHTHSFIRSVQHMLLFILLLKLSTLYYVKDAYQILLMCFIALVNALSWNFESYMLYPFFFTMFFIILSLMQLSKYLYLDKFDTLNNIIDSGSQLTFALGTMGISLLIAAIIFIFMPRIGVNYFAPLPLLHYQYMVGFSDKVKLGELGSIAENKSIAFRVKLNKKIDERKLYWRGVALDYFDGKVWINKSKSYIVSRNAYINNSMGQEKDFVVQKFYKLPSDNTYLFYLYPFKEIKVNNKAILIDENNNVKSSSLNYQVNSNLDGREKVKLKAEDKLKYLQLPSINSSIIKLNKKIIKDSDSIGRKISKIIVYLRDNYSYTKEIQGISFENPVYDFLFKSKKGNCEYFASALCILLRLNKIPCRLINGFIGGEYNAFGDYYIIRQSNAHSWVEAYIEPFGWIILDATPPQEEKDFRSIFFNFFANINDTINFIWENYILLYSKEHQIFFINKMKEIYLNFAKYSSWSGFFKIKVNREILLYLLISIFLLIFAVYLLIFLHRKKFKKHLLFYYFFILKMRLLGYKKTSFMTPLEFAQKFEGTKYENLAFRITYKYCQLKYGNN